MTGVTRVLIVDDEPDLLLLWRLTFELAGYEAGMAADGDEALRKLRKERFDVVVLDVMMPVLDGWGVLEALQGDDTAPPVVVVSAFPSADREQRAFDLGAAAYLPKPIDPQQLVDHVQAVLAPAE